MAQLNVKYLGLDLRSPIIIASSPFTTSVEKILSLEQHGAGAVVLKSVFEEQIMGEAAFLERYNDYPEATDYLQNYISDEYLKGHLNLIREAKTKVTIPIIASINCHSAGGWIDYARQVEAAGADALEVNIFLMPSSAEETSAEVERRYLDVIANVTSSLSIPVSVKLGMRFTNILNLVRELYYRKTRGVVMFNRFYEPDIDIDNMTLAGSDSLSSPAELRNNLRMVGMCTALGNEMDIAVSTGVHCGADAVKCLLAGAKAVEICSTIYNHGLDVIRTMNNDIEYWMQRHSFSGVEEFRGKLNSKSMGNEDFYQRAQYMKYFPKG